MRLYLRSAGRATALILLASLAAPLAARAGFDNYLALGDSITFGVGADQTATDVSNGDRGYVKPFADLLGARAGGTRPTVLNFAVSGETSDSFFSGVGSISGPGAALRNTNYKNLSPVPSQRDLFQNTVGVVNAAGNTISTVTVSLGSNDLFALELSSAFQAADDNGKTQMLTDTLANFQANYLHLLGIIRDPGILPKANLYLLGTYNPFGTSTLFGKQAEAAIVQLNNIIAADAAFAGAHYVDLYHPFQGNETTYTRILDNQNVHPTDLGYQVIFNQLAVVPEPASAGMLGLGVVLVLGVAWRNRRRAAA